MQRTPEELRRRLVEIDDQVRGLQPDAFARKHELLVEGDELRAMLREALKDELESIGHLWAERAGHKGSHYVDYEAKRAGIPSPIDN